MYKTAVASELVTKGECKLSMISMVSPSGTIGQIDVYDGQEVDGKLITSLSAVAGGSSQFFFRDYQDILAGIFVNVTATVQCWTVEYNP